MGLSMLNIRLIIALAFVMAVPVVAGWVLHS